MIKTLKISILFISLSFIACKKKTDDGKAEKAFTNGKIYTVNNSQVGSLEIGKEADFIILDRNIFEIATTQIAQTKVLDTYLQGRKVN